MAVMLGGQIGQRKARRTYCWFLLVVHMTGSSTAQVIARLRAFSNSRGNEKAGHRRS